MLVALFVLQTVLASSELEHGIKSFDSGHLRIAESYFQNILDEENLGPEIIEASYYLCLIYNARAELISQISATDRFLQNYPYDRRGQQLLDRLIRKFVEIGSYSLAVEYLKNYNYLEIDNALKWDIATGLIEQKNNLLADFVLAGMQKSDSVLILRASIADSFAVRERFYQAMDGSEKYIFLAELALASGDTLKAYEAFLNIENTGIKRETGFRDFLFPGETGIAVFDSLRMARGQYYFSRHNYKQAAIDLLVAGALPAELNLVLARSLAKVGFIEYDRYQSILKSADDSLLHNEANRDLLVFYFNGGEYEQTLDLMSDSIGQDTILIRMYVSSLAGVGKITQAESLVVVYNIDLQPQIVDLYTDYLLKTKNYIRARFFLDSLIDEQKLVTDAIRYKWALLPFIQDDHETALERFQYFIQICPAGEYYYQACFKIATIMYFRQDFSAGLEFYALAAHSDSLNCDALKNLMICAKKGGFWEKAIDAGKQLLPGADHNIRHEILYDIGYAYLRSGRFRPAIQYLAQSVSLKLEPSSLYWLAETYFGRGDFIRALYYYRRIIDRFHDDEMWTPTAYFKTGLVLEFMDAIDEAKVIYESIIKKRGTQDTWGIEAQQRLDYLR